jgi:hypothetical protein
MLIINKEFQNGIGRWLMDDYSILFNIIESYTGLAILVIGKALECRIMFSKVRVSE